MATLKGHLIYTNVFDHFLLPACTAWSMMLAIIVQLTFIRRATAEMWVASCNPSITFASNAVVKRTRASAQKAFTQIQKTAHRKGKTPIEETFRFARYVIVFTTFPPDSFSASEVLQWYRLRWQVELVFKRFKSLAQFGHLPKYDEESAKAWLYGKLLVALLTEKIVRHARTFSPWGYPSSEKPLERFSVRTESGDSGH
ncbi:MAG: transposase [Bacteroidota bacterium]|nr:transposase [Bacteroidota bacterium]